MEHWVCNGAMRLRDDINSVKPVPWPPRVEDLEEEEELSPFILKLLSALLGKKGVDLSFTTLSLTPLYSYVSKGPMSTVINATITLHGITRSKELVDSFYNLNRSKSKVYFHIHTTSHQISQLLMTLWKSCLSS